MTRAVLAIVVLSGLVYAIAWPQGASGHAALVRSEPGENAFLQRTPPEVSLTFTEKVDPKSSSIRVLDAAARPIALRAPDFSANGLTMRVALPALKPGIYNVLWENISTVDGHGYRGSYPFTLLNADGSLPAEVNQFGGTNSGSDPAPEADGVAVRALSLLGLILVAGGALLALLLPAELAGARRGLAAACVVGVVVLLIATLVNLATILDTYGDRGFVDVILRTRLGSYWLVRFGAALVIAVGASMFVDSVRAAAAATIAGVVAYLWGFTATSHAAAGAGSGWAEIIDMVHGSAALAWIGAVVGIVIVVRLAGQSGAYVRLMPRFALLAAAMVFVLLATGFLQTLIELDSADRLWTTRYGWTLTVKVGLIVALLGVALFNARRGRRWLESGAPSAPRWFGRTALAEALLGGLVFVAAAGLTQTTVSKSVYERTANKPYDQSAAAETLAMRLQVDPNRTGLNTYRVSLSEPGGAPVEAERVRLTFRYRDDPAIGSGTLILAPDDAGQYLGQGPYLTLEGQWQIEVEVRRAGLNDAKTFFEVRPAGLAIGTLRAGGAWANPAPGVSWNTFGGLVLALAALGVALFKGRLGTHRKLGWGANGMVLLGFGAGSMLLFGVDRHDGNVIPRNPIVADQDSITQGRTIYQQNCIACHGRNGVPPEGLDLNPYPLDLTVHVPQHPDGLLFNYIDRGIPGSAMRAWGEGDPKLSDDEMWHVVNYLRTLGTVGAVDK